MLSAALTFAGIVGYAWSQGSNVGAGEVGLQAAAVITWGLIAALLVGASVGLFVFATTWWRSDRRT